MSKLIAAVLRAGTGKTNEELSEQWQWNYFVTRSRIKAYWRTLFA